jgi:hypothetical protein
MLLIKIINFQKGMIVFCFFFTIWAEIKVLTNAAFISCSYNWTNTTSITLDILMNCFILIFIFGLFFIFSKVWVIVIFLIIWIDFIFFIDNLFFWIWGRELIFFDHVFHIFLEPFFYHFFKVFLIKYFLFLNIFLNEELSFLNLILNLIFSFE